jgi:hypothetical protein
MSTDRTCVPYPVRFFNVNESGTLSLAYSKSTQQLFCGGSRGNIAVVDFRQQKVRRPHLFTLHNHCLTAYALTCQHPLVNVRKSVRSHMPTPSRECAQECALAQRRPLVNARLSVLSPTSALPCAHTHPLFKHILHAPTH